MSIQIGNAPCSWGTLEFGSTKADRLTHGRMLDELTGAGYTGSELGDWGFMPTDSEILAQEFSSRGLTMTGAFVGGPLQRADALDAIRTEVLKIARLIGATADRLPQDVQPFLVLAGDNGVDPVRTQHAGRVTPAMQLTPDEWQTFATGANAVAQAVQEETGLRTVFHHHGAGPIETPDEIARLLEMTDPALLGLVFDTGHYAMGAGGCETISAALDRFADRIWYVHFKDWSPTVAAQAAAHEWDYFQAVGAGIFCELGQGCVDFPAVKSWLEKRGYSGFITVEQDVLPGMGAPRESAARNRAYLQGIEL